MYYSGQKTTILEITLKANESEYYFNDQEILRGKRIRSIAVLDSGLTKRGETIADPKNAYLELFDSSQTEIVNMNMSYMTVSPGTPLFNFAPLGGNPKGYLVDWSKSRVIFGNAVTAGQVLQLQVIYDHKGKKAE